jgi:hypothetical protein
MPPAAKKHPVRRAKLLKDSINRAEDKHDQLAKEIGLESEIAMELDADTAEAHALFLFGRNGKPIRDLATLSKATKVPMMTLQVLAPAWKREALRLARESSPFFAMASTAKSRANHHNDLEKMRQFIDKFEATLPDVNDKTFPYKYKFLMEMRREWQDAAGISAAIDLSKACMAMEAKAMLANNAPTETGSDEDLSAFDVDV